MFGQVNFYKVVLMRRKKKKAIHPQSEINENLNSGVLVGFDIDQESPRKMESNLSSGIYHIRLACSYVYKELSRWWIDWKGPTHCGQ